MSREYGDGESRAVVHGFDETKIRGGDLYALFYDAEFGRSDGGRPIRRVRQCGRSQRDR